MKLWSGRLPGGIEHTAALLNNSLPYDQRFALEDIKGSIAWAKALERVGILTQAECDAIVRGLEDISSEFTNGFFQFKEADEDIHTAVERRLTECIGAVAGKLHTGRSRNDQVATDFRLWMVGTIQNILEHIKNLQQALIERSERDWGIILPGYTHFQQAQPILFSHWWLSHFWALQRDRQRFQNLYHMTRVLPLGSGALAGSGFEVDRFFLAQQLDFCEPSPNSLDAVSDRDFAAEFLFCSSMIGSHLSRLAEALILYSTQEFGFIVLADEYSTGSSLMPQKKNPDPLELIRARNGFLIGRLTGFLSTLKGLPSAYDKDLQEDKPPVFDAADTLTLIIPVMAGVISTLAVNAGRTMASLNPQVLATDLADYLVLRGVPFRQAHSLVGQAVRRAEEDGKNLSELPLDAWQEISPIFDVDLFQVFNPTTSVERRKVYGGTAQEAVRKQLDLAKKKLTG